MCTSKSDCSYAALKSYMYSSKNKIQKLRLDCQSFALYVQNGASKIGSSGTHSVCVCTIHQNAILLVDAAKTGKTYKDLIKIIVCDCDSKTCMVHRCEKCPGTGPLRQFLETLLDENEEVTFQQWQTTDRSNLLTCWSNLLTCVDEFIDLLVAAIDNLTPHSYIAKCQANYLIVR